MEPAPLPPTGQQGGLDGGRPSFATLWTGAARATPRFFRAEQHALAQVQRRFATTEPDPPERTKRRTRGARRSARSAWRRGDCTHPHRRRLGKQFDLIALEE